MASSWKEIFTKNGADAAKSVGGAASRLADNITSAAGTGTKAGMWVGGAAAGAVNSVAKGTVKTGFNAMNLGGKLVNNPVGAFLVTAAVAVASFVGLKSWWDKRKARKEQEAMLSSPEGQAMMQAMAQDAQVINQAEARRAAINAAGATNEVSGDAVQKYAGNRYVPGTAAGK